MYMQFEKRLPAFLAGNSLLWLFFAFNMLLKGFYLSHNSLGGDEPFSVYHAQMSVSALVDILSTGNNPPLYEFLLHFWIQIFGISEWAVRLPSLLFSSFTVVLILLLGRHFLTPTMGFFAACLYLFSNYHLQFAQEARVYALMGLLTCCAVFAFLKIWEITKQAKAEESTVKKRNKWLIVWLLANGLLIYAHYFGFFVLFVQALFVLLHPADLRKNWKSWGSMLAGLFLLYLPNLSVFWTRFFESSVQGTWLQAPGGLDSLYNMLRQFANAPVVAALLILLFLAAGIHFLVKRKQLQLKPAAAFVLLWFWFIFLFMFAVSYAVPMFLDRYLMPAAIAFCFLPAMAINQLFKKQSVQWSVHIVLLMLFAFTFKPDLSNKREVKAAVEQLKALQTDTSLVVVGGRAFALNFAYYYDRSIFEKVDNRDSFQPVLAALAERHIYAVDKMEGFPYHKGQHILFLDAAVDFSSPDNRIKSTLDQYAELQKHYTFYEIFNLYDYQKKGIDMGVHAGYND